MLQRQHCFWITHVSLKLKIFSRHNSARALPSWFKACPEIDCTVSDLWPVVNDFYIVLNSFSFTLAINVLYHQRDFVKCVKLKWSTFIIFAVDVITESRDTKFSTCMFDWETIMQHNFPLCIVGGAYPCSTESPQSNTANDGLYYTKAVPPQSASCLQS